jgi:hypothetical protein
MAEKAKQGGEPRQERTFVNMALWQDRETD